MKGLIFSLIFVCLANRSFSQPLEQKDSLTAKYLTALKFLGKKFYDQFYPDFVRVHRLSENSFTEKIDSAAGAFYTLLETYQSDLTPEYIKTQRFEIKMYFDKLLVEYPNNHEIYTNERPKKYPLIEKRVNNNLRLFNDPALLGNSDLMPFVQSFLNYKINEELNKPSYKGLYNKRLYAMWHLLPQYIKNKDCRIYHRYHLLLDHISHNGIKYTEPLYKAFKDECKDTAYLTKLEQVYSDSRNELKDHLVRQYKKVDRYGLDVHIFGSNRPDETQKKPVIVFFHGGSWSEGQPSWHFAACRNYAKKGWIACSVEYRIYGCQGTLPFAAVMDARSAIRWLREHGSELGADTGRIVATGNSAGGHLVLTTALADQWNEKTDHLQYSPVPDVLLANSGVYDLTDEKTAWISKDLKVKDMVKGISPNDLVKKHLPPTLLIHSAADQNVPYSSAQRFAALQQAAGNKIELRTLEQGGHFIFDHPAYTSAVFAWRKEFLQKLGYPECDGE
jgi:acetyl esterase/lipase